MRICNYCGTTNYDEVAFCRGCGANDFKYQCDNCGTTVVGGKFCPKCGVKVGTRPKLCPQCRTQYFSTACPDCGYISGRSGGFASPVAAPTYPAAAPIPYFPPPMPMPVRKRQTWLWVLGWIFMFPIPATVLTVQNRNMGVLLKTIIIVAVWTFYFAIIASR